jgi:hypothetical protein
MSQSAPTDGATLDPPERAGVVGSALEYETIPPVTPQNHESWKGRGAWACADVTAPSRPAATAIVLMDRIMNLVFD